MKTKIKNNLIYFFILFFIGLGLVSCGNKDKKTKENDKIIIESFDYEISRSRSTVVNELSYNLSFDIDFTLNQKFNVDDLVVRIATVKEAIDNKKSFRFDIDFSNTEDVTFSPSTEQYPYILLKYAITDTDSLNVNAQIKITSKDLMDDINNFIKIDCYCESKKIVDENNILSDEGIFKLSYSDDSLIYYEFNEFSESYKVVSVIAKSETFEVPATYKGYPVKTIGEGAFFGCTIIKSIIIPDSVTNIEEGAMEGCVNIEKAIIPTLAAHNLPKNNLKEVTITSGTSIEKYAFSGCSNLTSITLPNNVKSIGNSAFNNCLKLTNVYYDGSLKDWCNITFGDNISNPMSFASHFYLKNSNNEWEKVKCVEIPNSITEIRAYQFSGFNNVTSVTIPSGVTSIGESAFEYCSNLTNVYYEGDIEDWCNITINGSSSNPMCFASHFYFKNSNNEWEELTNIEIPNAIIEIGNYQFYGFNNVTSITIPDGVTRIGECAFVDCSSFTSIVMPSTVMDIGNEAFNRCHRLVEIYNYSPLDFTIGSEDNGYIAYYAKVIHNQDEPSNIIRTINGFVFIKDFEGSYSLISYEGTETDIALPNDINGNVYDIKDYAFNNCSNISRIKIGESVKSIGKYAFYNCTNLTSVTIPKSVTSIGDYSFAGCYRLVEIYNFSTLNITTGSDNYGKLGYYAKVVHTKEEASNIIRTADGYEFFIDNKKYYLISYKGTATDLVMPKDIDGTSYSINQYAFYMCSNITSIVIPNSVTRIGEDAFRDCINLKNIVILNSVTKIESSAFSNCSNLINVYYEGSIEDWCNITFNNSASNPMSYAKRFYIRNNNEWEEVTSIEIPNTIIEIGNYQFYGFDNVISITIPNSVTYMGVSAFSGCSSLTSVTIPDSITRVGDSSFFNCSSLSSVIIPESVTNIGTCAFFNCSSLVNIIIPNSVVCIEYMAFCNCNGLKSIILPKASIDERAFQNCSSLTSVTIGSSVTSIGIYAFYNCINLTSITIPDSVISIGCSAFENCISLKSAILSNAVTNIDSSTFRGCSSLNNIKVGNKVTNIGEYAFYDCSELKSIIIPNSVTSIGYYAFWYCSNLKEVYFTGTFLEWKNISKYRLEYLTIYYYSETKPKIEGDYWHYVDGIATKW